MVYILPLLVSMTPGVCQSHISLFYSHIFHCFTVTDFAVLQGVLWADEYASYMVEGIPGKPYGRYFVLLYVVD